MLSKWSVMGKMKVVFFSYGAMEEGWLCCFACDSGCDSSSSTSSRSSSLESSYDAPAEAEAEDRFPPGRRYTVKNGGHD